MNSRNFLFAAVLLSFLLIPAAHAQLTANHEGKIDRSYGVEGFAILDGIGAISRTVSAATPERGIFIAHSINQWDVHIAKFLPNGLPDTTFGNSGNVVLPVSGEQVVLASALQRDGKLLVAGAVNEPGDRLQRDIFVMRLTTDGALDPIFGSSGVVRLNLTSSLPARISSDRANTILERPDGTIVIACVSDQFENGASVAVSSFVLVQLLPNGALDLAFGTSGVSTVIAGENYSTEEAFWNFQAGAFLRKDGKIVFNGWVPRQGLPGSFSHHVILARFLPNGELDAEFAKKGILDISQGDISRPFLIKEVDGGKLLAMTPHSLTRFDSEGNIDSTFGVNGQTALDPGFESVAMCTARDDKIVIAQFLTSEPRGQYQIRRFWPNGLPDIRFARSGRSEVGLGIGSYVESLEAEPDSFFSIVGYFGPVIPGPYVTRLFANRKR